METYRGYVMADETDSNGHMNVQYYTKKFDMASGQFLARVGFAYKELMEQNLGFAYVESTIKYKREVFEEDAIHVNSGIVSISGKVITIKHEMVNSITDVMNSECIMKWVIFDKKIRKAVAIPSALYEKLAKLIPSENE